MEKKQKGMIKATYNLGEFLIALVKLQFFWWYGVLKGGILLGVFPATSAVISLFFQFFQTKEFSSQLFVDFKKSYQVAFKKTNLLGFIQTFILAVLWLDIRVAGQLLQNQLIHLFLLIFFVFSLLVGVFLFPVYLRYELSCLNYFKQAFFLMIASIVETIAIGAGIAVVTAITTIFPILMLIAAVPLLLLPISWFSLQAMKKIEANNCNAKS